jgi:Flp pilus assembly protein TadG
MKVPAIQYSASVAVKRASTCLRNLCHDSNGATAVLVGLLLPVIIGGLGLGAETGYWYLLDRKLQHAVDVSAHIS